MVIGVGFGWVLELVIVVVICYEYPPRLVIWVGFGWVLELVLYDLGVIAIPALDASVKLGAG